MTTMTRGKREGGQGSSSGVRGYGGFRPSLVTTSDEETVEKGGIGGGKSESHQQ